MHCFAIVTIRHTHKYVSFLSSKMMEKRCDLVAFCFAAAAAAEGRRHTSLRRRHTLPSLHRGEHILALHIHIRTCMCTLFTNVHIPAQMCTFFNMHIHTAHCTQKCTLDGIVHTAHNELATYYITF